MQFDTAYSHAAETGQCAQANDFGLCATAYLVGLTFVSGLQWKSYAQTSRVFTACCNAVRCRISVCLSVTL